MATRWNLSRIKIFVYKQMAAISSQEVLKIVKFDVASALYVVRAGFIAQAGIFNTSQPGSHSITVSYIKIVNSVCVYFHLYTSPVFQE